MADCHNGPLLSDAHFHNTGIPTSNGAEADRGRAEGSALLREDLFNCLGDVSDARVGDCAELRFMAEGPQDEGAFRIPSLRGAATRATRTPDRLPRSWTSCSTTALHPTRPSEPANCGR